MWPYHPDLLARAVPRYTSYPTAADFRPDVGAAQLVTSLRALPPETPASLYVHIPFCRDICWYCGCNTNRANRQDRVETYLEALLAEIRWLARLVGGRIRLDRIAFGGGSPNAIEPVGFVRLVDAILTSFGTCTPEISVELDPRTLDRAWASLLGKVRAERASLGVQTLEPDIQARIGRVQPHDMIERAVDLLRENGVTSLNFDLMYGLPGQSEADLERTLSAALAMQPDRIALFGYAHVPSLIPRQRQIDASHLPGLEERFRQAALGYEQLLAAGMVPVGFDHFARPGDPLAEATRTGSLRRNFQGFTDDQAEVLLGVGATAVSILPDLIAQNEKNPGRYRMRALAGQASATLGITRGAEDRERGLIIEDLLCGRTADLSGLPDSGGAMLRLLPFLEAGLCHLQGELLGVTEAGLPYARSIAACFDTYRMASAGRFSSAV